ncbi:hypothetical protein C2W62_18775 [Candidatus Entotheonella serta]|nr:hypothetical protein C2W62_18775 [Candidatus Entotheonella serta]
MQFQQLLNVDVDHIIRSRRLSQAQAGEVLGLDEPKVSALLRGKLSGFSTDRL